MCCNTHEACLLTCDITGLTVCRKHYKIEKGIVVSSVAQKGFWRRRARKQAKRIEEPNARKKDTREKQPHRYRYFQSRTASIFEKAFAHQISGDVLIGKDKSSKLSFGVNIDELSRHSLIFGSSGSGKTNLLRVIQLQLYNMNIPFITFDTAKYATRYIKKIYSKFINTQMGQRIFFQSIRIPT